MKGWLAQVAAVAVGARIAILWYEVNQANAAVRAMRWGRR